MDLGLRGRVALVAGASSGLGYGVARALAAEGCTLSVCARDADRLAEAAEGIRAAGAGKVLARPVDVTDEHAAARWIDDTAEQFGAVHVLVTNAGGPPPGAVDSFDPQAYRRAVDTAVLPHIAMVLAALPHLRAAGWGRLLMIASETVRQPIARYGLSSTVRPALLGFARSLVPVLANTEITVNVLAPGYHDTGGLRRQFDAGAQTSAGLAEIGAGIPVGRLGRIEDFGAVVAFLASVHASFITGGTVLVDGGATRGIG